MNTISKEELEKLLKESIHEAFQKLINDTRVLVVNNTTVALTAEEFEKLQENSYALQIIKKMR